MTIKQVFYVYVFNIIFLIKINVFYFSYIIYTSNYISGLNVKQVFILMYLITSS